MEIIQAAVMVAASLGVCQALLLAGYLLILDRGNRLAHRLFALMLIGLSIRIGKSIFNYYLVIEPWQRNLGLAGLLLVGPSFWLYGRVISRQQIRLNAVDIIHFLPAALYALFCWLIPNGRDWPSYLSYALVTGQWAVYLILAGQQMSQIKQMLAKEASTWHRHILIGLSLVWCYYFFVFIRVLPFYLGGAVVYSMLIYGLTVLFLERKHFSTTNYRQTRQSNQQSQLTMRQIEQAMDDHQLYLQPKLTVAKMAEALGLAPRQVSRAINEHQGLGFAAFVKQYRLSHAKRLLVDPDYQKAKIATIAIDSGFGNVASFNSAFASQERITPSEYRDRARAD